LSASENIFDATARTRFAADGSAALRDRAVKRLNIAFVHVRDLAVADGRDDLILDHRPVVLLRAIGFLWKVLVSVPLGEVANGRRLAPVLPFLRGVFAPIDPAPKHLGFAARSFDAPFRKRTNREALLAAVDAIVDEEGLGAGRPSRRRREDSHAKAGDLAIPEGFVAAVRGRLLPEPRLG
jgi:hypothetical protein